MAFRTPPNTRKQKEIEEKIQLLLERMDLYIGRGRGKDVAAVLHDHIIARTGSEAGRTKVSLNLARAMVREQDFESTKAACAALKWVLMELDSLNY